MNIGRWKRGQGQAEDSSLVVFDPWNEMDRLFQRVMVAPWSANGGGQSAPLAGVPVAIDMCEDEKSVTVRAEVPGIAPEELDVTIHGDVLTISGEKQDSKTEDRQGYHRTERRFGRFQRSVQLPSSVDTQSVEASHDNGVVTITLQKAASAQPRRVEVRKQPPQSKSQGEQQPPGQSQPGRKKAE